MLLNCGVREDSWESLGLQGAQISPSQRKSVLHIHWKDWCWSLNSNTLATWCKDLTHLKRPWCWERLKAGGEADDRGWDGWMASPSWWTWVWVNSGSWWWTGKPGVLQSMGSQRVVPDWATELNKTTPLLHSLSASAQLMEALPCNWDLASLWDNSLEQMALIINTGELSPSISAHSSGLGCDQCVYEWVRESRYFISESDGLCCIQGTRSHQTDEKFKTGESFHWEETYSDIKKVCWYTLIVHFKTISTQQWNRANS